ncbi:DUF4032 domain-containing protein [Propioniciclava sp.]|uniref:DUF4032 domain-containing protein n=1 Tax=Propioniciclava sp. TaxID=2038686 RepID=UPI002617C761|nr:DUF4032 domain-containing protein [Propioniciclava sp.]
MPRFLSAHPDARLIPLPWQLPLVDWPTDYLVALPRGISRHVVRFLTVGAEVVAAKELLEKSALHEYRMLQDLARLGAPAVEAIGVVTDRLDADGAPLDPVLLTRHLQFSLPYRTLFSPGIRHDTVSRLLDAMVVLLARLHLIGFLWGDVSLSNILFRRDAGEFAAYLVDAETGELHGQLTDGQRAHDLDIAMTNLFGEFCDLEAGGMLDESLDPYALVSQIESRYLALWAELTGVEEFAGSDLFRIESRVRRLNSLGFDVAELDIRTAADGSTLTLQPKVVDAGHHSRRLLRLTGLDTEEHQAQRLLNDLDTYRARLGLGQTDEAVVAHKWLTDVFEPVVSAIPPDLAGKREPAQIFHEVLDYRWYASQREWREVPLTDAVQGYIADVLSVLPDEVIASDTIIHPETRHLANPFDPSQGFADDDEEAPFDPWEADAADPDVELLPAHFDIDALRRKAEGPGTMSR